MFKEGTTGYLNPADRNKGDFTAIPPKDPKWNILMPLIFAGFRVRISLVSDIKGLMQYIEKGKLTSRHCFLFRPHFTVDFICLNSALAGFLVGNIAKGKIGKTLGGEGRGGEGECSLHPPDF